MNLNDARILANSLMAAHGLTEAGWTFGFDSARKRLGVCRHGSKSITISQFMASAGTDEDVTQTMLHEIAHALVGAGLRTAGGKNDHHGPRWQTKARSIGYTGTRTASNPYTDSQIPENERVAHERVLAVGTAVRRSGNVHGVITAIGRTRYTIQDVATGERWKVRFEGAWPLESSDADSAIEAQKTFARAQRTPQSQIDSGLVSANSSGVRHHRWLTVGSTFTVNAKGRFRGHEAKVISVGRSRYLCAIGDERVYVPFSLVL